jgi:hexosaminidase
MNRRLHFPAKFARLGGFSAVSFALVIGVPGVVTAVMNGAPAAGTAAVRLAASATPVVDVVPKPVSVTTGAGQFTLGPASRILAAPGSASATAAELAVASDLAAYLRPATGYPLPTAVGAPASGDVVLQIGDPGTLTAAEQAEGYQLTTTASTATIEAPTANGLYDGIQTFRQLLPPWIDSTTVRSGPWTTAVVTITDYPRYQYRGVLLDIARHYEPPSAVEELIDQVAPYKINVLHLHLSDDQGFRLAINGFPRLTSIGSAGSVGTDGRQQDPGGFWTQAQYKAVVAYAAAHFITVIPEVDSPGHNNAIIMSEYNDTGNPALPANSHGIDCGQFNPPQWDYTEDVGYSALCPGSPDTWAIMTAIIDQISALTPGPYYDLGGDEVPTTLLSASNYAQFINQEAPIVTKQGKTVMGWADIAGAGTTPPAGSVAEYWQPAGGSSSGTETGREAVAKGMKVVMAPANHTYLDQKYVVTSTSSVPASLGMNWACPTGCDVSSAYNWDPGSFVTGVTDKNVIGVEGDMWTETIATMSNADYMVFPRLLALAEVAWSPDVQRTATSPAYHDFLQRLAVQGNRLQIAGVNFYPSTQVPWQLAANGTTLTASSSGKVSGTLATLSAPGFPTTTLSMCDGSLGVGCTINWGDGSATTTGDATGVNATGTHVNSLYTVSGEHSYAKSGTYHGTVTLSVGNLAPVTADFTVRVP